MYTAYDDLSFSEKKLYQFMVRDIAERMLDSLSEQHRKNLGLDDLTIYDRSTTVFEEAFRLLNNLGLLDLVYPKKIFKNLAKTGTPYGRLKSNIEEIPTWFDREFKNQVFMEEVLDSYVHFMIEHDCCWGGGKRIWHGSSRYTKSTLELFIENNYLQRCVRQYSWIERLKLFFKNNSKAKIEVNFCWTEKIAYSMWRNECWEFSKDNELEALLLLPLINELVDNIPEYVDSAIKHDIEKLGYVSFERLFNGYYRFEGWLPREEAIFYNIPRWGIISQRLAEALNEKYKI